MKDKLSVISACLFILLLVTITLRVSAQESDAMQNESEEQIKYINQYFTGQKITAIQPLVGAIFDYSKFIHGKIEGKFVNCSFVCAQFSYADLSDAEFVDCNFTNAYLDHVKGMRVNVSDLVNEDLEFNAQIDLSGSEITIYQNKPIPLTFQNADLTGAHIAYILQEEIDGEISEVEQPITIENCAVDYSSILLNHDNIENVAGYARRRFCGNTISLKDYDADFSDCVFYQCRFKDVDMLRDSFKDALFVDCVFEDVEQFSFDALKKTQNWESSDENVDKMTLFSFPEEYQIQINAKLEKEKENRGRMKKKYLDEYTREMTEKRRKEVERLTRLGLNTDSWGKAEIEKLSQPVHKEWDRKMNWIFSSDFDRQKYGVDEKPEK